MSSITTFGRCYRRFLRCINIVAYLPNTPAYYITSKISRYCFSPIQAEQDNFKNSLISVGFKFSELKWRTLWQQRLRDHALFCLHIFKQVHFNKLWTQKHITVDSQSLQTLLDKHNSVLFLTYHHAFHHALCAALGASGLKLNALAAPEESSTIFNFIGRYIHTLHSGCRQYFNGGDYLFFDNTMRGARLTKHALTEGGVLISLNDFSSSSNTKIPIKFFNRLLYPPIGSVKLACKLNIPIVTGAMIYNGSQHYDIIFQQLDTAQNPAAIMRDYMVFLENLTQQHPVFWDGWNWFNTFQLTQPTHD